MLVDYTDNPSVFPPNIVPSAKRPDITIWSPSLRKVIMIELTCPAEEGIDKAHQRKMARYQDLQRRVKDAEWTPILRTIEVGARGYIAKSVHRCFRSLGLNYRDSTSLSNQLSNTVVRCSHHIYLSRNSTWDKNIALLEECSSLNESSKLVLTHLIRKRINRIICLITFRLLMGMMMERR